MGTLATRTLVPITNQTVEWTTTTASNQTVYTNPTVLFDSTDNIVVTIGGTVISPTTYARTFNDEGSSPSPVTITLNSAPQVADVGKPIRVFVADNQFGVGYNLTGSNNPVQTQQALWKAVRNITRVNKKVEEHPGEANETAEQIRDKLETLQSSNRLPSTAIDGLLTLPDNTTTSSPFFHIDQTGTLVTPATTAAIPITGQGYRIPLITQRNSTGPVLNGSTNPFFTFYEGQLRFTASVLAEFRISHVFGHVIPNPNVPDIVSTRQIIVNNVGTAVSINLSSFNSIAFIQPGAGGGETGVIPIYADLYIQAFATNGSRLATNLTAVSFSEASGKYLQLSQRILQPNQGGTGLTPEQIAEIAANTAKIGITPAQASAIVANTGKVGITPAQASAIVANTGKVGITPAQASAIVTNTAKVGLTDGSVTTDRLAIRAVGGTNIKEGNITSNLIANDAVGLDKIGTANTGSQGQVLTRGGGNEIEWTTPSSGGSGITPTQAAAIAANTAKVGITPTQASAISANTAKVGITPAQASAIVTNTAKVGLTDGSVDSPQLADGAVTANKMDIDGTIAVGQIIEVSDAARGTFVYVDKPSGGGGGTPGSSTEGFNGSIFNNTTTTLAAGNFDTDDYDFLEVFCTTETNPQYFTKAVVMGSTTSRLLAGLIGTGKVLSFQRISATTFQVYEAEIASDAPSNETNTWRLTFIKFGGSTGAQGPIGPTGPTGPAGSGLTTQQANELAANTLKVGITQGQADAIVANSNKTGITQSQADNIVINTGKVGLTNGSVTTARLANDSVTIAKLSTSVAGVTGDVLTQGPSGTMAFQPAPGGTPGAGSIGTTQLANGAVTADKIATSTITSTQLAANSVGNSEIVGVASDFFDTARAVTTDKIRNNAVTGAKIADNAITPEHIDGTPVAGQVYTATSATRATWQTPTGGGTPGATPEQASAIALNTAKVGITPTQASAIAANTLKVGITQGQADAITINAGKVGLTNNSVTTNRIANGAVTQGKLALDSVGAAQIIDANVTVSKIAAGSATTGQVLTATSSGMDWQTPAEVTLADSSVTTVKIADFAVTGAKIGNNAVGQSELAAGAVGTDQIIDANVTAAKLATNAVTRDKIAAGSFTGGQVLSATDEGLEWITAAAGGGTPAPGSVGTTELANSAVTEGKIANLAVSTSKIQDGAVSSAKIPDSSVTSAKLVAGNAPTAGQILSAGAVSGTFVWITHVPDGSVDTAELANNSVTTNKIADSAVTTGKIADSAVTTGKIADSAVTRTKISAGTSTTGQVLTATATGMDWTTVSGVINTVNGVAVPAFPA